MKMINPLLCTLMLGCASDYELKGAIPDVNPGDVTDCDFSPVAGTKISMYDCNPVFTGGEGGAGSVAFYTTEVLGHPFYQIWHTDDAGSLNYSASSNGTSWKNHDMNPVLPLQSNSGGWDQDTFGGQVVVWDPIESQYVMSYQGINYGNPNDDADNQIGIGVATSSDGISWARHPNNPIINFDQYTLSDDDVSGILYFGQGVPSGKEASPSWPLTITVDERGSFRGYVGASENAEFVAYLNSPEFLEWQTASLFDPSLAPPDFFPRIHVYGMNAFSAGEWILNVQQPVMRAGDPYDLYGITSASVVEFEDTLYMFYIGFKEWTVAAQAGFISAGKTTINLATSTDGGITWTKDPNNPIPINLTEPGEVSGVGAQVIGSRIHLWVTDSYDDTNAVGYFYFEPTIDVHP